MLKTSIQIRFSDIDALRHVNNVCLQYYYDMGKEDFMRRIIGVRQIWDGPGIVQANSNNNYYEPVFLDDTIEVRTLIRRIGNKSITMFQQIVSLENETVKSDSTSVLVAFDIETQLSMQIPLSWRAAIVAFGIEEK